MKKTMGFADSAPKSGGYHAVQLNEGMAQSAAKKDMCAHGGGKSASKKSQPNHVGGARAGA